MGERRVKGFINISKKFINNNIKKKKKNGMFERRLLKVAFKTLFPNVVQYGSKINCRCDYFQFLLDINFKTCCYFFAAGIIFSSVRTTRRHERVRTSSYEWYFLSTPTISLVSYTQNRPVNQFPWIFKVLLSTLIKYIVLMQFCLSYIITIDKRIQSSVHREQLLCWKL